MLSWEERQVTTETAEDLNVKAAEAGAGDVKEQALKYLSGKLAL